MRYNKALMKIAVIVLVITSFIFVFLLSISQNKDEMRSHNQDYVCFDDICVNVEFALADDEIKKGLMFRASLPESSGMLFIFEDASIHKFWMKNTLIPLDIIWLDDNTKIIYIEKNAPPCTEDICPTYGPDQDSRYILEVNAGYTDKHDLDIGNVAAINR